MLHYNTLLFITLYCLPNCFIWQSLFDCGIYLKFKDTKRQCVVLLVDDDPILETARKCLMLQGDLDVETASSSNVAIKKMEEKKPDVIIYSFEMRGENPIVFLRELRDKGYETPFVGLIADNQNRLVLEASHLGVKCFVKKFEDPQIFYPQLKRLIMSLIER
jgi:DNA-binding NarL/FixJ family response regulator